MLQSQETLLAAFLVEQRDRSGFDYWHNRRDAPNTVKDVSSSGRCQSVSCCKHARNLYDSVDCRLHYLRPEQMHNMSGRPKSISAGTDWCCKACNVEA